MQLGHWKESGFYDFETLHQIDWGGAAGSHPAAISWLLLAWAGASPKNSVLELWNSSGLLDRGLGDGWRTVDLVGKLHIANVRLSGELWALGIVQPHPMLPHCWHGLGLSKSHQSHRKGGLGSCFSKLLCKEPMCLNTATESRFIWVQLPAGIWQGSLWGTKALLGMITVENKVGITSDSLQIMLLHFFPRTLKTALQLPSPSRHRCLNSDGKRFLRQAGNFVESQLSLPLGSVLPPSCDSAHCSSSFTPSAAKTIIFCKTHLERIPEYPALAGNASEPPTYCIQVGTCERSEQMFQGSDRISCLPKNGVCRNTVFVWSLSLSPKTDGLINCLHIQLNLKTCA